MAILGDNDLSRLFDDAAKVDRDRKRNFATQMRRSGADALGFGEDLLALFTTLPAAVIASERAEYDRVVKRYGEEHPRSRQVAEALAAFEGVEAQAARGRARATRAIEAIQASGTAFFGFVTGGGGDPRVGYSVRLSGSNVPSGKLQAVTGDDGYFRIGLPASGTSTSRTARRGSPKSAAATAPDGEADTAPVLVTVEVLDRKGSSVYQDPVPLQMDAGSAYREYQIDDSDRGKKQATRSATATRKPAQKAKPPSKKRRSR